MLLCYLQRSVDGKNYWTFEYELESPSFARTAFATIAIGNGMFIHTSQACVIQAAFSKTKIQKKKKLLDFRISK